MTTSKEQTTHVTIEQLIKLIRSDIKNIPNTATDLSVIETAISEYSNLYNELGNTTYKEFTLPYNQTLKAIKELTTTKKCLEKNEAVPQQSLNKAHQAIISFITSLDAVYRANKQTSCGQCCIIL